VQRRVVRKPQIQPKPNEGSRHGTNSNARGGSRVVARTQRGTKARRSTASASPRYERQHGTGPCSSPRPTSRYTA
jgi:hypothetical protein